MSRRAKMNPAQSRPGSRTLVGWLVGGLLLFISACGNGDIDTTPLGSGMTPQSSQTTYRATVIKRAVLRTGPGTQYTVIGVLRVDDVVRLEGRNEDGDWLHLDGVWHPLRGWLHTRGWIERSLVDSAPDTLPVVDEIDLPPPVIHQPPS